MNKISLAVITILALATFSCKQVADENVGNNPDWAVRKAVGINTDSLRHGKTYLPVYAQIYHISRESLTDLAATISIRNTDEKDSIFIDRIDYFNTDGKLIKKHLDNIVFVKPFETIEVVIKSSENEGGTGANFIFNWYSKKTSSKPLFEAVMISTSGQQGISFTSRGVDVL